MEQQYEPPTTKLALQSDKCYHVFLSFRGPDVRKTLVQDLFHALSAAGLYVFIDSEELQKGADIELSLKRAIEKSAIRIPVFSKGYADSTWCLKEAAQMLNTPGLIIPFFYDVSPTDVRYPEKNSSPYKKSFQKHYGHLDRHPREEVDEWKRALHQICSRSGWSMDITQPGFEARLVKTVVNDLIKTLDRVPLEVAKYPVGMDSVKNALLQKLNLNSVNEVVKVGIWGIGGIGKTTVAKALYNQVSADFDAQCFVFNVRATATQGLEKLQKQILKSLCKYYGEVDSVDYGKSLFRDRLGGRRVLLILDDVDAFEQLNALVGDWLAPGSRLIVTTRDKQILKVAGVSSECIHEMSGLEINEGLQLFSWHAFLRASPNPSYGDLSKRIVEACKGHPLSLEVLGSFLYDNNAPDCWMEALNNITRNPEIHERLYISYRALTDEEKEIFLDIACFFVGEDKTRPMLFWKSLNYKMVHTAVSNLSLKLLIKIEKGVFGMHDHLQDMGRSIAEKEKEGTRLWEAAQLSTISYNFSRVRLNGGNPQRLKMLCRPRLRYLHLQNQSIEDPLATVLPSSIWLRLKNCLRCLHLQSQPIEDPLATVLPSLIWLRLECCDFDSWMTRAIKRPRHFRCANNICQLKTLQLIYCDGVSSHSIFSIFSIPNIQLQHLELRGCGSFNNLPGAIGNLSQLQYLDLEGCQRLNNLPDTIGNLSQLQHLDLRWCRSLNNLPDTIGNLSQLQHLDLGGCGSLNNLPDTIGNLSQLQHLDLGWCGSLNNLPDTIGNLSQLQHLDLGGCGSLNELPDTIGNLSQLQYLNLSFCGNLNNLHDTIGNLSQLQHLDLERWESLDNLPDTIGNLSRLQHLNLRECKSLNELPDTIGNLSQLQCLDLTECKSLSELPDTICSLSAEILLWLTE